MISRTGSECHRCSLHQLQPYYTLHRWWRQPGQASPRLLLAQPFKTLARIREFCGLEVARAGLFKRPNVPPPRNARSQPCNPACCDGSRSYSCRQRDGHFGSQLGQNSSSRHGARRPSRRSAATSRAAAARAAAAGWPRAGSLAAAATAARPPAVGGRCARCPVQSAAGGSDCHFAGGGCTGQHCAGGLRRTHPSSSGELPVCHSAPSLGGGKAQRPLTCFAVLGCSAGSGPSRSSACTSATNSQRCCTTAAAAAAAGCGSSRQQRRRATGKGCCYTSSRLLQQPAAGH